jgi:hypothetical protein
MNPVTRITFQSLADFIKELQKLGIKRIFRDSNASYAGGAYTALEPTSMTYLVADVEYPEGIELQRALNPQYMPGENHYGRRSGKWSSGGDWCTAATNGKKEFVDWLKKLKVDPGAIKGLRSTKISDLTTLIDDSNTDDDTDFSVTLQEKRGRGETDLTVNLCGGLVTKLLMRIQKERHGTTPTYQLIIDNWPAVLQEMQKKNEEPFVAASVEILVGKIEVLTKE